MRGHPSCLILGDNIFYGHGLPETLRGARDRLELLQAAQYVHVIEKRQGLKVACPEEIAFHMGLIDKAELASVAAALSKSAYGQYLARLVASV